MEPSGEGAGNSPSFSMETSHGAGGALGHNKVGVGSSWATMPVLGQLPWELFCQPAGQRNKWRTGGTGMAESVVGSLLMFSEAGKPQCPVRERG